MNRLTALLVVFILWAAIYLPGLGGLELRGEEGRRIEPGLEMLKSGDWLVPRLHGRPYLTKPPLMNWAVAFSMKATGHRDEWAGRLPSVISILALAGVIVWTGSAWMTPAGALMAAIFCITSVEVVDKGRMAEIEAIYLALTGIAFALWIGAWMEGRKAWRLWLPPMIFLGLGLLAKGPTNLLLFYLIVIPLLSAEKEKKSLWSLPHLGSLAACIAIFCLWLIPYRHATAHLNVTGVWADQMAQRVGGGDFRVIPWLSNIPRAWSNAFPWILLAPLWWSEAVLERLPERQRLFIRAARWPVVIGFLGLMLIPGMLPRYTLPILPAGAIMVATVVPFLPLNWRTVWRWANCVLCGLIALAAAVLPWFGKPTLVEAVIAAAVCSLLIAFFRLKLPGTPVLAISTALVAAAGIWVFSAAIIPHMRLHLRPMAETIDRVVPPSASLCAVDRSFESALFYVRHPYTTTESPNLVPNGTDYVFVRQDFLKKLQERHPAAIQVAQMEGNSKNQFFILKLRPLFEKTRTSPVSGNDRGKRG